LARKMSMKQPTLQYIVSGKTKRCRISKRAVLASEFGIQETWLAGEQDAGPFRNRQLDWAEQQGTNILPGERRAGLPPLVELRAARLIEGCLRRWGRELASGIAPPPDADSLLGQVWANYKGKSLFLWLGAYFEDFLFSPKVLRAQVYEFPHLFREDEADLFGWYWSLDAQFTLAWITTLDRLLSPWLTGRRRLDYPACYRLLEKLREDERALFFRAKRGGALRVVMYRP
jgi:hypothetical protein